MRQWNYLQASFLSSHSDAASGILWSLGTRGIEECPLFAGKLRIKAYFDPLCDIRSLQREFKAQCNQAGIQLLACSLRIQSEQDWFRRWRHQLQPFTVGKRFWIVPYDSHAVSSSKKPWLSVPAAKPPEEFPASTGPGPSSASSGRTPSLLKGAKLSRLQVSRGIVVPPAARASAISSRIPIYIEPGMAFGTGTHETTQLCIEALEQHLTPGRTCLDVGTGSGILAMAAVKLGARSAIGCDVDPIALDIAAANGVRNNCSSRIRWVLGQIDRVRRCRPGCLVANLTVEIIEQEFEKFLRQLQPRAVLILSGLLSRQVPRIEKLRRKSGLRRRACMSKGEWTCLVYRR